MRTRNPYIDYFMKSVLLSMIGSLVLLSLSISAKAEQSLTNHYKLITDVRELEEDALYILAYTDSCKAISNSESTNNRPATSVKISEDHVLTANDNTMLLSLTKSGNYWKIRGINYPGDKQYFTYSGNSMYLKMGQQSDAHSYDISFSDSNVIINTTISTIRQIRYNLENNYFRHLDSASSGSYSIQMYKLIKEGEIGTVIADKQFHVDSNGDQYLELECGEIYSFSSEGAAKLYIDMGDDAFEASNPAKFIAPREAVKRIIVNSITPTDNEGNLYPEKALKDFYIKVIEPLQDDDTYITVNFDYK